MRFANKLILVAIGGLIFAANPAQADVNIFGLNHSPVGAATLTANPDNSLTVGNLGSSGNDGMDVDLSGAPPDFIWIAEFGGTTSPLASPGAFTTMKSFGTYNGVADTLGATYSIAANSTGGVQITANFLVGDPNKPIIVEYENNGAVVAADPVNGTQVTFAEDKAPKKESKDPIDAYLTFDAEDEKAVSMTTIDGEQVTADEVDIFGPYQGTWKEQSEELLAGGSISSYNIDNETVSVLPEPASMLLLPAVLLIARRRTGLRRGDHR